MPRTRVLQLVRIGIFTLDLLNGGLRDHALVRSRFCLECDITWPQAAHALNPDKIFRHGMS